MTSFGPSFTSDVITFDQNWHHLYSTSAGGKDAQIRVIGVSGPEICTNNAQKAEWKTRGKFPATTPGGSMVTIARFDDAFLEVF